MCQHHYHGNHAILLHSLGIDSICMTSSPETHCHTCIQYTLKLYWEPGLHVLCECLSILNCLQRVNGFAKMKFGVLNTFSGMRMSWSWRFTWNNSNMNVGTDYLTNWIWIKSRYNWNPRPCSPPTLSLILFVLKYLIAWLILGYSLGFKITLIVFVINLLFGF
jgi:hypothetical protein